MKVGYTGMRNKKMKAINITLLCINLAAILYAIIEFALVISGIKVVSPVFTYAFMVVLALDIIHSIILFIYRCRRN